MLMCCAALCNVVNARRRFCQLICTLECWQSQTLTSSRGMVMLACSWP